MLSATSFLRSCMNPFISMAHQAALDRIKFLEQRLTEMQTEGTRLVLENRALRDKLDKLCRCDAMEGYVCAGHRP